ncbi:MAG TPA: Crp/Fnr family transcriptional regulator [Myxococcota bacterium]|jgi:CRP-like cAMP-binding protein
MKSPEDARDDTGFAVRSSHERTFAAGEVVYDAGQPGEALFVIQSGHIELTRGSEDGYRVVARHGPGEFFGEIAVLLGRPRTSRAVAVADARVLQLDRATFEAMCADRPEIALRVIQRLAERAIELEQRLAALGVDDLLRPIVRVLLRHASAGDKSARIESTLRKLANEAGLRMIEAHRALNQLIDQKLVRLVDDALEVRDFDALAATLDPGE